MLEDKTNEQRPAETTPPPKKKRGEALQSFWRQVQCSGLLHRHHFRRSSQEVLDSLKKRLHTVAAVLWLGEALYTLGFITEYAGVRIGRAVRDVVLRLVHAVAKAAHDVAAIAFPGAAQVVRDLFGPIYVLLRGCARLIASVHTIHGQKGFGAACREAGRFVADGVRSNIKMLPRMVMYILPACMLAVFVSVFSRTINEPYALAVQVNGQTVGYVANENVFNSARDDIAERINYAGADRTKWTVDASYAISVAHDVMDENEMANAILRSSGDEISEGTAIYLDGELTAVSSDGEGLREFMDSLLAPYEVEDDPNTSVTFNKSVALEDGIYFNESFENLSDIESMLTGVQQAKKTYTIKEGDTLWMIAQENGLTFGELCGLNPDFKGGALNENSNIQVGDEVIITKEEAMLEVRITKIETHEEEIAFSTETTQSDEYDKGTTKTLQEGQNGVRRVTSQNVYDTNGTLVDSTVLSTEVIKEPVTKKVVVGTKKKAAGLNAASYITGSGQFIWPVPGYRNCSRWYSSGHKGVDICAAAGTPIYASAGGTVSKAGYNKAGAGTGYGYSVIISHSGGYSTVYGHCLSLTVSAGQKVRQGQLIGYVGSTGRSSGNHCHFEIRLNGSYVPPQRVFSGK